jgi:hypothetical protein
MCEQCTSGPRYPVFAHTWLYTPYLYCPGHLSTHVGVLAPLPASLLIPLLSAAPSPPVASEPSSTALSSRAFQVCISYATNLHNTMGERTRAPRATTHNRCILSQQNQQSTVVVYAWQQSLMFKIALSGRTSSLAAPSLPTLISKILSQFNYIVPPLVLG